MLEGFIVDSEFDRLHPATICRLKQRIEVSMEIHEDLSYRQSCGL